MLLQQLDIFGVVTDGVLLLQQLDVDGMGDCVVLPQLGDVNGGDGTGAKDAIVSIKVVQVEVDGNEGIEYIGEGAVTGCVLLLLQHPDFGVASLGASGRNFVVLRFFLGPR